MPVDYDNAIKIFRMADYIALSKSKNRESLRPKQIKLGCEIAHFSANGITN